MPLYIKKSGLEDDRGNVIDNNNKLFVESTVTIPHDSDDILIQPTLFLNEGKKQGGKKSTEIDKSMLEIETMYFMPKSDVTSSGTGNNLKRILDDVDPWLKAKIELVNTAVTITIKKN